MMENIRNKIGLSDKNSTYLVEDLGKKIEDIIKGMTKYELMKWRMKRAHCSKQDTENS